MAIPLIGMAFVYEQTMGGHVLAILTGIGGLAAGDYHFPMHLMKKSEVCKNKLSYWLIYIGVSVAIDILAVYVEVQISK